MKLFEVKFSCFELFKFVVLFFVFYIFVCLFSFSFRNRKSVIECFFFFFKENLHEEWKKNGERTKNGMKIL